MFQTLSRGWSLTKMSFRVLSLDKEILALPLMAGVLMILAVLAFGFGAFGLGLQDGNPATYAVVFAGYVAVYFIAIFFNAAVIEMATIRFNGGDPVIKDGLRKASSRAGRIFQWAIVAATVGLIFRMLRDQARDNFLARILISFLEFGWNVATFFAVPIAVYQDVGPMDAIKGSMRTMKRTWGESLTGVVSTGFIFFLLGLVGIVPIVLGFLSGSATILFAMIALAVVYWVVLAAVNSAVDGILVAALYKYATEGRLPSLMAEQGMQAEGLVW